MPQGSLERIRALDAGRVKPQQAGSLERVRALDAGRKKSEGQTAPYATFTGDPAGIGLLGQPRKHALAEVQDDAASAAEGPFIQTGEMLREAPRRIVRGAASGTASLIDEVNILVERMSGVRPIKPGPALAPLGITPDDTLARAASRVVDAVLPPETPEAGAAGGTVLNAAEGLGQSLPLFVPGVATAKAPALIRALSVAGTSGMMEMAGAYDEAIQAGATKDEAWNAGVLTGAGNGLIEGAAGPIPRLMARWDKASGGTLGEALKRLAKTAPLTGAQEAATEGVQEIFKNVAAKVSYDEEREILRNAAASAKAGGLIGVVLDVLTSMLPGRARARSPLPEGRGSIDAQFDALREGRVPAVLVTPGSAKPANVEGLESAELTSEETGDPQGAGTFFYTDPATLDQARSGDLGGALGYGTSKKPETTTQALVVRDAQGRLVRIVAAEEMISPEVQEAAERVAGEGGTVEAVPIEEIGPVLQERAGGAEIATLPEAVGRTASERLTQQESPDQAPLVVYHGTKGDFADFDIEKAGASDPGLLGPALYFTPSAKQAKTFAESSHYGGKGGTPKVVRAEVLLKNPAIIVDGVLPDGRTLSDVHPQGITQESGRALGDELRKAGYDGAIFKIGDEVSQVVAFDSKQVKQAPPAPQADATGGGAAVDEGPVSVQEGPVETSSPGTPMPSQSARGETGEALRDFELDATTPPPARPPDAVPTPEDDGTVSIKNRMTEARLADKGLPPPDERERMTFERANEEAAALLEKDPLAGVRLMEELRANKRAPTPVEDLLLDRELVRLENRRDELQKSINEAAESGDVGLADSLRDEVKRADAEYLAAVNTTTTVGTESSYSLLFRKAVLKRDYSLARIEQKMRAAKGGEELTDDERTSAVEDSQKIKDLEKKLDEQLAASRKREADLQAELATERMRKREARPRKAKPTAGPVLQFITARADEARKRIKERGTRMYSGFNPAAYADEIIVGAEIIAKDIAAFADWSKAMISELGDGIRPRLTDIFEKSKEAFRSFTVEAGVEDVKAKLRARIDDGEEIGDLRVYVRKVAEAVVNAGTTETVAVIDATHQTLTDVLPDLTRDQVRDIIGGRGEFKPLSKTPAKVRMRQIRGEIQQILKLEALLEKRPLEKIGPERRVPDATERSLQKIVADLKKKYGVKVTDPDTQIKGVLDSIKTRLRNQIEDIQRQIDTKVQTIRTKGPSPRDAEIEKLEAQRDALLEQYHEVFAPSGSEKQTAEEALAVRVLRATRALETQIEDYGNRLADADTGTKPKGTPVSTPELEALRARRDALAQQLADLRSAQKPKRSKEEAELQALKSRMTGELATLTEADFLNEPVYKAKKKERTLDDEALAIQAELEAARRANDARIERIRRAQRTRLQKAIGLGVDAVRAHRDAFFSLDLPPLLRQGSFVVVNPFNWIYHPKKMAAVVGESFKAIMSEKVIERVDTMLHDKKYWPLADKYQQAGGVFTRLDGKLSESEEGLQSRFARVFRPVRATGRGFTTLVNLARAFSFEKMHNAINATPEEDKALTNFGNVASGRGEFRGKVGDFDMAKLNLALEPASIVFTAPRRYISRLQLLVGQPLWRGNTRTRLEISKSIAGWLTGWATIHLLAGIAGSEDREDDPTSSDFWKVVFGPLRLDFMDGISQFATLLARTITGETVPTSGENAGKVVPLRNQLTPRTDEQIGYRGDDLGDVWGRFARSREAPFAAAMHDLITGKHATMVRDAKGKLAPEPVTPRSMFEHYFKFISWRGTLDLMEQQGIPKGLAFQLLNLVGASLQNYDEGRVTK